MSMILPRNFTGINQAILAIGDSWFWYPNSNLVDAILRLPKLKADFRSACVLGKNGAKLAAYRDGEFASEWRNELKRSNFAYSVVMISGGGNDVVDLGLVHDVRVRGDVVTVVMSMPHRGRTRLGYFIDGSISVHPTLSVPVRERLMQIPGVRQVVVQQTWHPTWNSNRVTTNGRKKLGLPPD